MIEFKQIVGSGARVHDAVGAAMAALLDRDGIEVAAADELERGLRLAKATKTHAAAGG
ncbi:hypothetical protein [Cypionkella sp. TWP1-2-1b2]|uniref:hypothetical protein n=1 Tax=Cypionkella sp. TWP1-2-1b2 TaxID=2804675 RepID=UPI003CE909CD